MTSGQTLCPSPNTFAQFVLCLSRVSASSGVNPEVPAQVSRLRLHFLWSFAPPVSSRVSLQNFACRVKKKKKAQARNQNTGIILSISRIEFSLLCFGRPTLPPAAPSPPSFSFPAYFIFFFMTIFFSTISMLLWPN